MTEWLMFISSLILAGITLKYVLLTRKLVNIQQEMLKISNTPEVQIFLTYGNRTMRSYTVDLFIGNLGTGIAFDLKFSGNLSSFRPDWGAHTLAEWKNIRNGIRCLGPGARHQRSIYEVHEDDSKDLPTEILTINVTYTDVTGKKHDKTFRLNFNHIESYTRTGDPSMDSVAVSLQNIDKSLSDIKDSINHQTGFQPPNRQY